jgi:hypothetical protein
MKKLIGQVINNKFVSGKPEKTGEHQLHREFVRNHMREKYAKDIVQPYKNGQPNPEYIEAFGKDEATKQFGIKGEIE